MNFLIIFIFAIHSLVHYFYPYMTLATLFGDWLCVVPREGEREGRTERQKAKLSSDKEPQLLIHISEPVFVDLSRIPGNDSQPAGRYDNPIYRTGPPGYIGFQNRFLGIDSWAP
jgi:hypothetical protein